jgi:streptomycin 6-kinase
MEKLITKVTNTWGDKGTSWLQQLPLLIESLAQHWSLMDVKPVTNLSYNYVATATQNNNTPVVLKISCDKQLIADEYKALQHFDGRGSIKVLDININYNALLLQQAIPGHLLKEHHPIKMEDTIAIYADVVKQLSARSLTTNDYVHVREWCKDIDGIRDERIEKRYIQKAQELKKFLLSSADNEYLCHGDLHLENIIAHGEKWLSIDPKGIIGEMAFEAAAFNLTDYSELSDHDSIQDKISVRVKYLANALQLDTDRLLAWIFLRVIISAQWFIEDNGDPEEMLQLMSIIYRLISRKI